LPECADKLILETILQDKFSYFKAEEGGVAVATATDDNAAMEVSGKALHIHTIKLCRLTAVVSPCTCTELDVAVRLSPVEDGLEVRARVADGEQVYMEYKGLMTVV
jgi:hypothetical protein